MGSSPSKSSEQKKVSIPRPVSATPVQPPAISGPSFEVFLQCLTKLPFTLSEEKFETIIYDIVEKIYTPESIILQSSQPPVGIFVIVKGKCNILASDNLTILRCLKKGDFFGEISCLYDTSCSTSVISDKEMDCNVLLLPIDKIQSLHHEIPPMKEWYVQKKYIDVNSTFPAMGISALTIKKSMLGCPIFQSWSEEAIDSVYNSLLPYPIEIYFPSQIIFFPEDQMSCAYLLIHGEVEVFSTSKSIIIEASDESIWFGDEQLFSGNPKLLTARAKSPCQVVTFTVESFESIGEGFDFHFETTKLKEVSKFWRKHLKIRDKQLYEKYFELMSIVSLIDHLKQSEIFKFSNSSFLYYVALGSILRLVNKDDVIMVNNVSEGNEPLIIMILFGGGVVMKPDVDSDVNLYAGDTFYFDSMYEPKCHVRAIEETLLGIISKSLIQDVKTIYPAALVNVDW